MKIYQTYDRFLYARSKSCILAVMPYATMELDFLNVTPPATESERLEIEFYAEKHPIGEVMLLNLPGEEPKEVVLGPDRDYPYEIQLHAVGNPDHGQYADTGPHIRVRVMTIEDAEPILQAYQVRYDMGGGNCSRGHGNIWKLGGKSRKKLGRYGYGGKFQTVAELKAEDARIKTILTTPS